MKSFGLGTLFPPSLGYDLSRNALVGPFAFPEKKSDGSKDFADVEKLRKITKVGRLSKFTRKLPRCFYDSWRVFWSVFECRGHVLKCAGGQK